MNNEPKQSRRVLLIGLVAACCAFFLVQLGLVVPAVVYGCISLALAFHPPLADWSD